MPSDRDQYSVFCWMQLHQNHLGSTDEASARELAQVCAAYLPQAEEPTARSAER